MNFAFCNSACALQTNTVFLKKEKVNWAKMVWLIQLSQTPWNDVVYSPRLRMRHFVMICLRLLNKNGRNTWLLPFFSNSMRNKNCLWQHFVVTINMTYSAALQTFAFFRLALRVFVSVTISVCFCDPWSSHSTSLLVRAAKEAKLIAAQMYLKPHCDSDRRSAAWQGRYFINTLPDT